MLFFLICVIYFVVSLSNDSEIDEILDKRGIGITATVVSTKTIVANDTVIEKIEVQFVDKSGKS